MRVLLVALALVACGETKKDSDSAPPAAEPQNQTQDDPTASGTETSTATENAQENEDETPEGPALLVDADGTTIGDFDAEKSLVEIGLAEVAVGLDKGFPSDGDYWTCAFASADCSGECIAPSAEKVAFVSPTALRVADKSIAGGADVVNGFHSKQKPGGECIAGALAEEEVAPMRNLTEFKIMKLVEFKLPFVEK